MTYRIVPEAFQSPSGVLGVSRVLVSCRVSTLTTAGFSPLPGF